MKNIEDIKNELRELKEQRGIIPGYEIKEKLRLLTERDEKLKAEERAIEKSRSEIVLAKNRLIEINKQYDAVNSDKLSLGTERDALERKIQQMETDHNWKKDEHAIAIESYNEQFDEIQALIAAKKQQAKASPSSAAVAPASVASPQPKPSASPPPSVPVVPPTSPKVANINTTVNASLGQPTPALLQAQPSKSDNNIMATRRSLARSQGFEVKPPDGIQKFTVKNNVKDKDKIINYSAEPKSISSSVTNDANLRAMAKDITSDLPR